MNYYHGSGWDEHVRYTCDSDLAMAADNKISYDCACVGVGLAQAVAKATLPDSRFSYCKEGLITILGLVQGTNDSSIVSKCSMAKLGYFKDEHLQYFVSKTCRRSPLINRGYYVRQKAIDHILTKFLLKCNKEGVAHFCQIVSLGAGFDSSFFRLKANQVLSDTKFIEIDFPEVVQRKHLLIKKHPQLLSLCEDLSKHSQSKDDPVYVSKQYSLIGCDLRRTTRLRELLSLCGVAFNSPTLLLSECVLTYLDPESATNVISFCQKSFSDSMVISYEQIIPNDAFGIVMQKHFNHLNSPLKCINTYPKKTIQLQRLKNLGYSTVSCTDMNDFYQNYIDLDERQRIDLLEPFDEFEEWHLKCAHYCLISGYQGICETFESYIFDSDVCCVNKDENNDIAFLPSTNHNSDTSLLSRFGHSMCCLGNSIYIITGGFGLNGTKHERLNNVIMLKKRDDMWISDLLDLPPNHPLCEQRMFHTISLVANNYLFVYGGRISPTKPCVSNYLVKLPLCTDSQEGTSKEYINLPFDDNCPQPRWRHTAVNVSTEEDINDVIIFGGRTSSMLGLSDIWSFSPLSKSFKKLSSSDDSIPTARHSHGACWFDDQMIVYGGLNKESQPMSLIESYSFKNGTYQHSKLPLDLPPRYSHTMHTYNRCVFAIGGVCINDTASAGVVIEMDKMSSTALRCDINPIKPLMLHTHTSSVTDKGDIIVVGGGGNCFSFGTHFNQGVHELSMQQLISDRTL